MDRKFVVTEEQAGRRLDLVLTALLSPMTRSHVQKLIEGGAVTIKASFLNAADKPVRGNRKLQEGEQIFVAVPEPEQAEILAEDIEKLIEERQAARKAKDFARADAIRDELLEKGIILKDTREGVQWKRA